MFQISYPVAYNNLGRSEVICRRVEVPAWYTLPPLEALMICRIIQALSSGICEAIPVQLVNDVFFRESACNFVFTNHIN